MKTIRVKDVLRFLNDWAPPTLAEDWDHVGLQWGALQNEVKGILTSLDVTEAVLEEVNRRGCNLLITHHPLAFEKIRKLKKESIPARLARKAAKQKTNILSFHTNLDSSAEGLNHLLAKRLKLLKPRPLVKNVAQAQAGMGRLGELKAQSLQGFLKHLSKCLALKKFRYVGDLKTRIRKIAVVTGSGAGYFLEAQKKGADVLVTGDVKYHTALDALSEGMCLVDIGHFEGEVGMQSLVAAKLRSWPVIQVGKLKVYESKVQKDPLQFWPR